MAGFFLKEPTFSEPNGSSVRLMLENSATSRVLRRGDSIAGDLGEYELAAVQYVYRKGRVTAKELAGHLGRSVKVSRPVLRSLVERGILDCHGSSAHDPAQYYSLHRSK
jgi:ATP-dependent DNA helicase RecG